MLKQFIAIVICFFLSPRLVIAQSPPIVLDSLENRVVLLYLYNAQDFTDDGIALWIPDSVLTKRHPDAVKQKVSYTKILGRVYSENQCTIFFATFYLRYYSPNSNFKYIDEDYFNKAIFVKNNTNQWVLQSFVEITPDIFSKSNTQVEYLSDLSSKNVLKTLYKAELLGDSSGLYHFYDGGSDESIILYAHNLAKIYFEKVLYYQYDNKDYALVITSFESVWCRACHGNANLALFVKESTNHGWRLLRHNQFWQASTQFGYAPDLDISSVKINGIDTKVLVEHSNESGAGGESNFDLFYSLEDDFKYLFSHKTSSSNAGHEFNNDIENLLKMGYHNESVYMLDTAGYDFKLVYYENGIYQKTEFYNDFKIEKICTFITGNESFIAGHQRYLWIDHLFTDSLYTFEYLSQYSGIDLEIFQFLNENPPTKKNPAFIAPFYLHQYFHLLFDKNKNFDLEKISKEYNVSIEQIQRINQYNHYDKDKYKDHFLLVPKKN